MSTAVYTTPYEWDEENGSEDFEWEYEDPDEPSPIEPAQVDPEPDTPRGSLTSDLTVTTAVQSASPPNPPLDPAERARRLKHRLQAWHEAIDASDLPRERPILYFIWKAWAGELERGGRGLLAIPERRLSDVVGRDRKETWGYVRELHDLRWLEIKEDGQGGPEFSPEEWRSAVYGLGWDGHLETYWESVADAYHWQDQELHKAWSRYWMDDLDDQDDLELHAISSDGTSHTTIRAATDHVLDLIDAYDSPKSDLTSYTHHYPQECMCGVHVHVPNSSNRCTSPGDNDHTHAHDEGSDGPARWSTEKGLHECHIPVRPAASSPLDYLTASDTWVDDKAGVSGWLIARSLVQWVPVPERFRRASNTLTTAQICQITGWASKNVSARMRRLVEKGYAERTGNGWYFAFEDMYRRGRFFLVDKRQQSLRHKNSGKKDNPRDRIAGPPRRLPRAGSSISAQERVGLQPPPSGPPMPSCGPTGASPAAHGASSR